MFSDDDDHVGPQGPSAKPRPHGVTVTLINPSIHNVRVFWDWTELDNGTKTRDYICRRRRAPTSTL